MDRRTAIGQAIASARALRQMTQFELAQAVGRSQPSISDIERGKRDITVSDLDAICTALGTPVFQILDDRAA